MFCRTLPDDQFLALFNAFTKACAALGISYSESDIDRREELATLLVSLSNDGERDADAICAQAVHQMRPPASGSFFNRG